MRKAEPDIIPVYLFTGFLDAGKTRFIQETLEDERFNSGENTLLLLCEDGECRYRPELFASPNVYAEMLTEPSSLEPDTLAAHLKKHSCTRVMVELNGMWPISALMDGMPEAWSVCQCFFFADARSILSYNANMRQLVYDKLSVCDLAVFNRYDDSIDRMALHKLVRGVTRRADIAYEYTDGRAEYDDTEDPLPFDTDSPVVEISDRDYAIWYRDISEDAEKYGGKTVRLTGLVTDSVKLPDGSFVIGRKVMTCCEEDIRYMGLVCSGPTPSPERGAWLDITAKISIKRLKAYGRRGPVLELLHALPAAAPDPEVATFY